MRQQVNLLTEEHRPRRELLAPRQVLLAWAGLLAVLLAISGWQQVAAWRLAGASERIESEWRALVARSDALRDVLEIDPEPELIEEVETLRSLFNSQSLMVEAVRDYEQSSEGGFSGYFRDLADGRVPGLALSRIELRDGGSHILLSGETEAPVNVPRFLKRLSGGPSFRGHRFDEFRVEAQSSGLLRFDIVGPAPPEAGS